MSLSSAALGRKRIFKRSFDRTILSVVGTTWSRPLATIAVNRPKSRPISTEPPAVISCFTISFKPRSVCEIAALSTPIRSWILFTSSLNCIGSLCFGISPSLTAQPPPPVLEPEVHVLHHLIETGFDRPSRYVLEIEIVAEQETDDQVMDQGSKRLVVGV